MSPSQTSYLSNPYTAEVPLTPPDDMPDVKPKVFTNLNEYTIPVSNMRHVTKAPCDACLKRHVVLLLS